MMQVQITTMAVLAIVTLLLVALSGGGVGASGFRRTATAGGRYKLQSVVKEYANKQGFEAKLAVSPSSGNDPLGRDIGSLSFIAR